MTSVLSIGDAIPNEYVVVFKQHIPEDVCVEHCDWAHSAHTEASALRAESDGPELTGVGDKFNFEGFNAYVASIDESLKNEIEAKEEVAYVEPNQVVVATGVVVQKPVPSWGLARVSSNKKLTPQPLPRPPPKELGYEYDATAGTGTWGYVIDTGIRVTHKDFGGRAKWGTNTVAGSSNTDMNGHGTHVAGTMGGTSYGLAKKCTLIAVKVLGDNGQGSTASVMAGIDWAVKDSKNNGRIKKSVANMSLGGGFSQALNNTVAAAVKAGLTVVVAAGNDNKDASGSSPASEPLAYTIGSIDSTDGKSSYSNFGKCLDLWGPGRDITSAWKDSDTATNTISGTSMASPHIAGLALALIATNPTKYCTPAVITQGLTALATKNTKVPTVPAGTTTLIGFNGL